LINVHLGLFRDDLDNLFEILLEIVHENSILSIILLLRKQLIFLYKYNVKFLWKKNNKHINIGCNLLNVIEMTFYLTLYLRKLRYIALG
jgi:hypothetical protein